MADEGAVAEEVGDDGAEVPAAAALEDGGDEAEELPELMDLIDAVEEAPPEGLGPLVRKIRRRVRATPADRDLLSDFEGIQSICQALSRAPHEWRGDAMLEFCRAMPDICRQSTVNRGSLRDAGFVAAVVEYLRHAVASGDEEAAAAAAAAISALCTANDGNKKAAAQLWDTAQQGAGETKDAPAEAPRGPGALIVLLDALSRWPESERMQTEGVSALRSLVTDDDPRKFDCQPSAVDNREVVTCDDGFPYYGLVVERALGVVEANKEAAGKPMTKLHEQGLLFLRELARRQDRVQTLALDAKLLPRVQAAVAADDPRVSRAALAVLRNFSMVEEVRDEIGVMTDGAQQCLAAVRKHVASAPVCEAGFGLLANLTMRKSALAARLLEAEPSPVGLGLSVLKQHRDRPDVSRSTVHTLRNLAYQEESAAGEAREAGVFNEVRRLVQEHETDPRWKAAVDMSRQFLREFREDEGMEKKAQYNAFY